MVKRLLSPILLALPALAFCGVTDRIFDFTDEYYRANGVDPLKINGRRQAPSARTVVDTPFFSFQRNVRMIGLNTGYGHSGSPLFFAILGGNGFNLFTKDAAGRKAQQIADEFPEYIFPSRGANPVGLGNARQSVVLVDNHGYYGKNPLGLWIHVWVNYTERAFTSKDGKKELEKLAKKNGLALDGTPIIKTESEIEKLTKEGFVTQTRTTDASRYAICPVVRDPRNGGISADSIATFLKRADGTYVEPELFNAWTNLQTTGDWGRRP